VLLESVRMVAAWLDDATHGVNAILATLPRDGADTLAPDVTVLSEVDSERAALGRPADTQDELDPTPAPVLAVSAFGGDDASPATVRPIGDGTVRVLVRYEARNVSAALGRRDAYYTLRAVQQCLRALSLDGDPSTDRTRNAVHLIALNELRVESADAALVDAGIYGQVVAGWDARDLTMT
jgi:hypothetical protein